MGTFYQRLRLSNAARPELEEVDARALVDTGAAELCIPRGVALQLKLEKTGEKVMTLADGRTDAFDYVGPVLVECFGRKAHTGALVMGDKVILGAVPMEVMDVLVHPAGHRIIPNPEHPNIPGAYAMGVREPDSEPEQ